MCRCADERMINSYGGTENNVEKKECWNDERRSTHGELHKSLIVAISLVQRNT
jgi:hypothetical protein